MEWRLHAQEARREEIREDIHTRTIEIQLADGRNFGQNWIQLFIHHSLMRNSIMSLNYWINKSWFISDNIRKNLFQEKIEEIIGEFDLGFRINQINI